MNTNYQYLSQSVRGGRVLSPSFYLYTSTLLLVCVSQKDFVEHYMNYIFTGLLCFEIDTNFN